MFADFIDDIIKSLNFIPKHHERVKCGEKIHLINFGGYYDRHDKPIRQSHYGFFLLDTRRSLERHHHKYMS